ncbi:uncharacterized protein LOC143378049 [Andrena cerasifolii]|uniref:uncharacterized protein LOC143378049 n=1 Tax=Andrena cerasifolii TaxID=2819439 RepID=UPI004037C1D2
MQPGVTVVLATVWLAVYAAVVGTSTLHPYRLALDQYSPLAPRRHGVHRRVGGRPAWRDQNPAENQPLDLSIYPRRSITTGTESLEQSIDSKYFDRDLLFPRMSNSALDDFSSLAEDKQSRNIVGREFTDEKVDGRNTKGTELPPREQPPSELEDPFVADDTFQDQGPGSVEIYKLDLLREKPLLDPTPVTRLLTKNKSKTPKKTSHVSWKSKTTEYKATSPKMLYKQSNSFDDFSTGVPPNNDPFSVGGVPELQVGCEGLEASNHKQKRSIDSGRKDKKADDTVDFWVDITPVSLEMNYDSAVEDEYEEMDELVKLKKLENTTKNPKRRGDIDATRAGKSWDDKKRAEKLPVRGDLGNSRVSNDSAVPSTMPVSGNRRENGAGIGDLHSDKAKREALEADNPAANQGRKILWLDDAGVDERHVDKKRSKRGTWGFGEDEGVVSSDELQTETQRRRQYDNKRRQDEEMRRQEQERRRQEEALRRGHIENRTNSDIGRIREEYERRLEQAEREEKERRGRLQQESQRTPANRWQQEEEYRRRVQEEEARRSRWQGEERRRQEVQASRGRYESRPGTSSSDDEERKRQRLWEEELKRREEHRLREEERRRVQEEEARRKEQREREEEIKRRQQQELDRRSLEDRRREWMLKRMQDAEEERRRQQSRHEPPANLAYPVRSSPNETRVYRVDEERRMMEQKEREREQKLREYVQRNRPINVNGTADPQREEGNWRMAEEDRRRAEEERKLQEYIRRNQPIHVPKASGSYDRNWLEYRRTADDARLNNRSSYPGPGNGRSNHGPSAPTNIDPQNYVHEARRRDEARRIEEERAREAQRMEALRREEEVRRMQSRRYEEQRRRQEAARLEAEKRAKEVTEEEARRSQAGRTRPRYEERRRFEEHRRRQDTRLIPANLFLNESRRAVDLGRQTQEQERWRVEAERRRQQESRATEAGEQRTRAMKEQWRRQEEARLNALPVSARIIVRHGASSSPSDLVSRAGFDNDIDFTGINPTRGGVQVPNFPVPPTQRPPAQSPSPCVWAVVQCCPRKNIRLVSCFEATGCPGVNWDPNPCRVSIQLAAKEQVRKFYAEAEPDENL